MILAVGLAAASSCCQPATGAETDVLDAFERAGLGLAWRSEDRLGSWAGDGGFSDDEGYDRVAHTLTLGGRARVARPVQVALELQGRRATVWSGDEVGGAWVVGDPAVGVRLDAPPLAGGSWAVAARPALDLGVVAPLRWQSADGVGATAFEDPAWVGRVGAVLPGTFPKGWWTAGIGAEVDPLLPAPVALSPAVSVTGKLGATFRLAGGVDARWSPGPTGLASWALRGGLDLSWHPRRDTRVRAGVAGVPPVGSLGQGAPAAWNGHASVFRGFGTVDED